MHGSIGNRPLNSRFDPDSPLGEYSQCTVRRIGTYTSSNHPANLTGGDRRPTSPWATWTRCGPRPKTVYRLLGPDACSDSGPSAGPSAGFGNDMPVSPVALPHKALALLGMQEASGFGSPSSPEPRDIDLQSEFADDSDSDETQHHPHRLRCRHRQFQPRQQPCQPVLVAGAAPVDRPPERLYFRPESLCSAFSTASGRIPAGAVPAAPTGRHVPGNGASSPTKEDIAMLNLEDTDDDTSTAHRVAASKKGRGKGKSKEKETETETETDSGAAGRLPLKIRLQICECFVEEMHQEDLAPYHYKNSVGRRRERPRINPRRSESDEACDPECDQRCPNCKMHALWALSLVSRSWSQAATQALYRSVSLDFGTFTTNALTGANEFAPHSSCRFSTQHRHDVEARLQRLYRTIWDSDGDVGRRIRAIKLPRSHFSISKYPLSAILQKCPNLESLDCALATGSAPDLVSVLSKLTQMRRWTWMRQPDPACRRGNSHLHPLHRENPDAARDRPSHTVALQVLPHWANLEYLELRSLRPCELPDAFDFCALPALKHLVLHRVLLEDQKGRSDGLMERLPQLQRLEIDGCDNIAIEPIVSYVAEKGAGLTHLRLRVPDILPIFVLFQLLSSTPHIVDFSAAVYTSSVPTAASPPPPPAHTPPLLRLGSLERIDLDVAPLREALEFLLQLLVRSRRRQSDGAALSPLPGSSSSSLKVMRLGFGASGKSPWLGGKEGAAMDRDEMRSEVRLRTGCLFNDVKLIFYEDC